VSAGERRPRCVVLLSGGLDSAVCLAAARADGRETHALSFDYGQRHRHELRGAERVAASFGVASWRTLALDLRAIGGSALTADIDVPKNRPDSGAEVPVTYVPARNLVFLSLAAGLAEVLEAREIYIGVNAVDYSGYPDCRPEFIESFERTVALATRAGVQGAGVRVRCPLASLSKARIIELGARLGVDFSLTHSCYDPVGELSCGSCDSCHIRARGFAEAGVPDPTRYVGSSCGG
jgi:7-cyano-7-deazaguanine synthase